MRGKEYILQVIILVPFLSLAQKDGADTIGRAFSDSAYNNYIQRYKNGVKDFQMFPSLVAKADAHKDEQLASELTADYISYLDTLSVGEGLKQANVMFLAGNLKMLSTEDAVFKWFLDQPKRIDAMTRKGFSQDVVAYVISNRDIAPILNDAQERGVTPNWVKIQRDFSTLYGGDLVARLVVDNQIAYYRKMRDHLNIAKYTLERIERYGLDTVNPIAIHAFNAVLWDDVFLHVNNPDILRKSITVLRSLIINRSNPIPYLIDTYANLLYKAGHRQEGIHYELMAMHLDQKSASSEHRLSDPVYKLTVNKMEKGKPTWEASN